MIGEVTLSLICCEKERIDEALHLQQKNECSQTVFLCPSLITDGEIVLIEKTPFLLPEALSIAAFHLSITQGLPLNEYTFLFCEKQYYVRVEKDEQIVFNVEKCKQIYSNIEISGGKYSVFANVYDGLYACSMIEIDCLRNANPKEFSTLLMQEPRTRGRPFCLYEKEERTTAFAHYSFLGAPLLPTLSLYAIYGMERFKEGKVMHLPYAKFSLSWNETKMKVLPKRLPPY